ncbi:hypothetical protein ACX12E_08310 [Paenibacillus vandeheii]
MKIGARIYYDKDTGIVIQEVGERSGNVVVTTIEQDFASYVSLAERVPETVGIIQFDYEDHKSDREAGGIITRIDLETNEALFIYPNPSDPETPEEPRPSLSKQVDMMQQDSGELKQAVAELSLVLAAVMGGGE